MRTILLTLFLSLAGSMANAQVNYAVSGSNAYVTNSPNAAGNIVISPIYGGFPVTSIGANAFLYCSNLTNVVIGSNVTSIGVQSFNHCANLTGAVIPDSVTNIGSYAFEYCTSLKSITLGTNLVTMGDAALGYCSSLGNLAIPDNVRSIQSFGDVSERLLVGCTGLTNLVIGKGITNTYANEFASCSSLVTVTIGIPNIGGYAFQGCTNLASVILGANLTNISDFAFNGCTNLGSIIIPNCVTYLGDYAFASCTKMTNILFLGIPPTLGTSVFSFVPGPIYFLNGITNWVPQNYPYYGGVQTKNLNTTTDGLFQFVITNGTATITNYTSSNGNVMIPAAIYGYPVTSIGNSLFMNHYATLTNVVIPSGITNIGNSAFNGCYLLKNLTIPGSVTTIGLAAFSSCGNLTNITFLGNAPALVGTISKVPGTVYYYYGTTGWGASFGGLPTAELFLPPQISGGGMNSGRFGFTLAGGTNQTIVVEASTDLINWRPLWTNTLAGTNTTFTDSQWTNYPTRFYRAR